MVTHSGFGFQCDQCKFILSRRNQKHSCQGYSLLTVKKSTMIYTDQERNEFTSFQKNRSQFIEPFMKKVVPNFNKPPGAKRSLMIQEPVGAPQSEKVHSMKESTPSQHVQKSPILPPAKSPILPLLSPESTISILSPLPATLKLASSATKDLERHKSRKYVSSSSSDDSSSNSDEEDPTKTQN